MHNSSFAPRRSVGVALAVLGGLVVWGRLSAPTTRVTVIAGLDASASMRSALPGGGTLLGQSRAALADLAGRLQPGLDRLVVARVDRQTSEFFDEAAPTGSEAFLQTLLDHTRTPPSTDGTHPANFWRLAARRAASLQQAPGAGVAVAFLGDGDNDDLTKTARDEIRAAARALAANPRVVSVEFFGVNPKNWDTLRELFAPLGARLRLHPPQQMEPDELLARLQTARQAPTRSAPANAPASTNTPRS